MKIVFRVDSGSHIGIGHVMRCLTLAKELKANKIADVFFITKNHLGFAQELISKDFFLFVIDGGVSLPLPPGQKNNYHLWLGESYEEDLKKTNECLDQLGEVDMVIVDHYSLNEEYEKLLRCKKIMVIDDLMTRKHHCHILLDQNLSADLNTYSILNSQANAKILIGPSYSLLRNEFFLMRDKAKKKLVSIKEPKKILIFFGGADVGGDCMKFASSLSESDIEKYSFTFILNENHLTFLKLQHLVNSFAAKMKLLSSVDNMAEIMIEHDFFIGAGGSTSWERVALGMPSAILSVADNQTKISEALEEKGLVFYLGHSENMNSQMWQSFISNQLIKKQDIHSMAKKCFALIDGKGTSKVVMEILGSFNE